MQISMIQIQYVRKYTKMYCAKENMYSPQSFIFKRKTLNNTFLLVRLKRTYVQSEKIKDIQPSAKL